ncbi:DUF2147 domain-containing protein [Sphingomonas sp.]|uniref:DUF2147 domain-containing protein n=1 Tax=Sphingomonas sp. TaxID=28214 RepID=UPI002B6F98B9|nr:DUF2147 domain-containing protein [Sphingomonas sp.]HWK37199.1 DUF2147 domain-containing protein [Sphingomonas sp.]
MKHAIRRRIGPHLVIAVAALATLAAAPGGAQSTIGPVQGEWRNGRNTVHIRTYPCGDQVCGVVSWADATAEADARRGGTQQLRGTQIFREFRPVGDGSYKGRVFVPDLNSTFSGRLTVTPDGKLLGKGCLIGGLFCKTTTWLRVQ